jgi:hypothetical protein
MTKIESWVMLSVWFVMTKPRPVPSVVPGALVAPTNPRPLKKATIICMFPSVTLPFGAYISFLVITRLDNKMVLGQFLLVGSIKFR